MLFVGGISYIEPKVTHHVGKKWKNWGETLVFEPDLVLYPESKEDIRSIILKAKSEVKTIRVIGSGHSFTPLIETQFLVSLDKYTGIIEADREKDTVKVKSGTKLKQLGELLFDLGYMMENLGDIDVQSIAGALSTGTHGTGSEFGILSTQIMAIELIDGNGEIQYLEHGSDDFRAAQVSFGTMGIITEITLQVVPAYKLHYQSSKTTFDEVFENLEDLVTKNRNFEFYYFPHSEYIQLKESNITDNPVNNSRISSFVNDRIMENTLFGIICSIVKFLPRTAGFFSKLAGATISSTEKTDWGHKIYATIRKVKFVEMEYSLPVDECEAVLRKIKELIETQNIRVNFPIEVRFVKGDDIILSPAREEDRCFIAVHMYKGMPYEGYFRGCEDIFLSHGGRPHWGKLHYLDYHQLSELYPELELFDKIRKEYDPDEVFLNEHTASLFKSK